MRPLTYSWIGLSAASPLIFLICAWALGVFNSYRRYWRSVDLFLLAIFVQEILTALQVFAFSLLSLVQPHSTAFCGVFIWSLSATRTLQAATVTSLLVDRALTSQWPYRYRFSVRRHQIRYHLVVLATMAALVGVAAILARPSEGPSFGGSDDVCHFLPHSLHVRLALFLLSLYGILILISGVSVCVVHASRGCKGGPGTHSDTQDIAPITHGTTGSSSTTTGSSSRTPTSKSLTPAASSASTASSSSSGRVGRGLLQSASSTTDLVAPPIKPYHRRTAKPPQKAPGNHRSPSKDFRWGATMVVAALCLFVNHLPYMGLLIAGTFFPTILPEWPLENLSLWFSLLEGLLIPIGLGLFDSTFGEAASFSCTRRKRPPTPNYEEPSAPFRMTAKDEVKSFPLTNGSLFSSLLTMNGEYPQIHGVTNYNRPKGVLPTTYPNGLRMGNNGCSTTEPRPSFEQVMNHQDPRTGGGNSFRQLLYGPGGPRSLSVVNNSSESLYSDPLNKAISSDSSLKTTDDDHIYATLSETFGSLSSISDDFLGESPRCPSATTDANDDFEYHGPRMEHSSSLPRIDVLEEPGVISACNGVLSAVMDSSSPSPEESYSHSSCSDGASPASSFRSCSTDNNEEISMYDPRPTSENSNYDTTVIIEPRSSPRLGFINGAFVSGSLESRRINDKDSPLHHSISFSEEDNGIKPHICPSIPTEGTLTRKHRSMNDLDRLESRDPEPEEEMMFILPVKSESMLSLYRLYLAEDEDSGSTSLHYSLEISKSENDLTACHKSKLTSNGRRTRRENLHVQEIYRKKRVPLSAASRIRRQHKIQRVKGLQHRGRPFLPTHEENPRQTVDPDKYWNNNDGKNSLESKDSTQEVQLAVMNKAKRKNGIITIKDPSVLSVEELFKVLNRASGVPEPDISLNEEQINEVSNPQISYPITEYKKIFVSEYI